MANDQVIARIEGKNELVLERSISPTAEALGEHDWTMELFWFDGSPTGTGRGLIEWVVESRGEVEHIGIWTEDGELTDYDGVFSLPDVAIPLLEKAGIKVGEDFRDL